MLQNYEFNWGHLDSLIKIQIHKMSISFVKTKMIIGWIMENFNSLLTNWMELLNFVDNTKPK